MQSKVFANDGGPLIAMDGAAIRAWPGGDVDYSRACGAEYPAGVILVQDGVAVVIGAQEGIATARWHNTAAGEPCLIGCVFADDGADVDLESLLEAPETQWSHLAEATVPSGKLILFHGACAGSDINVDPAGEHAVIGHGLSVALEPGRYPPASR